VYGDAKTDIVHVPAAGAVLPLAGATVELALDWQKRYAHMRVHTALHLLCSLVPFPVTGGQIGADGGRLDFDIPDPGAIDRGMLNVEMNRLIREDHPVRASFISDDDLAAKPELVRTMSVKPPTGSGQVRLVAIGRNAEIDLQPCGGTHVRSTGEIGQVNVGKLESKGRQNRRIRVSLA
jgi:misacylated tRNA(Ala) deacylase